MNNKMKIITTHFEPFGGRCTNASKEVAEKLPYPTFELPVSFERVTKTLDEVYQKDFDLLVMFGEAGKYESIKVETRAQNLCNGVDNDGVGKNNEPIVLGGQDLLTKVKIKKAFNFSVDAGKYLCNYAYYYSLSKDIHAIFIHIPYISLEHPLDELIKEIEDIIQNIE